VCGQHKLDVLDAVVADERLPRAFLEQGLPQAQAKVLALRTQHERALEPKPSHPPYPHQTSPTRAIAAAAARRPNPHQARTQPHQLVS
jgi:hypothetical protein